MFYLIANFKSNLVFSDLNKYLEVLDKGLSAFSINSNIKVILCPSYPYLNDFNALKNKFNFVSIASQDVSATGNGAFTGDVNAAQLKDFCDFCIVGHSERRRMHNESDADTLSKVKNLLIKGITPIVCVSNLQELESLSSEISNILVAFEPIEYIGGSVSAPMDFVDNFIVDSRLSQVIYGGSVNIDNAEPFITNNKINGLLVGGYSLNPVDFLKLIQKTNTLLKV